MTLTIITITYNASRTLPRTLDSIAQQDYSRLEHIIIDGNSTDNTVAIATAYRATTLVRHPQRSVIIISEPDDGLYYAMNKGLTLATGDYVLFLNAGDTLPMSNTITTVINSTAGYDPLPAVLYGDTDIVDNHGQFLAHRRLQPPDNLSWQSFKNGMLVCHQAFYALTTIARETPYDTHYRYSADVDWCIRVMKTAEQQRRPLVRVHAVIAHYLSEGLTTSHHRASLIERFHILRRHYGLLTTILHHLAFALRAFR